jgi:hypothetical protein
VSEANAVLFAASASDAEDGDLSFAIVWSSSLAGPLGSGPDLTLTSLAVGTHLVTASVTDSGALAASASLAVTIDAKPVVGIASPANGLSVKAGMPISFAGSAVDLEDGDLSATLVWASSKEGVLGVGASLTRALRAKGTHVITASARDSTGANAQAQVQVRVR